MVFIVLLIFIENLLFMDFIEVINSMYINGFIDGFIIDKF